MTDPTKVLDNRGPGAESPLGEPPLLNAAEALAVALSTGPMHDRTMAEAIDVAPGMLQHLHRLGYVLVRRPRW